MYSLSYDSDTAHIPLSLPEVPTLQLPPLANMRNLEIPYSSSILLLQSIIYDDRVCHPTTMCIVCVDHEK